MGIGPNYTGFARNDTNTRLDVYVRGTLVAHFDDGGADLTLVEGNGLSGGVVATSTPIGLDDDVSVEFGDNDDAVMRHTTAVGANTAISDVLTATVVGAALTADSLVFSTLVDAADIVFYAATSTSSREYLRIDSSAAEVVINDGSADINLRVESDNSVNALFVQGSDGFVGILKGNPAVALDVTGAVTASGIIKTDDGSDATSTTDGSLQTDGGISLVKDIWIGAKTNCVGLVEFQTGGTVTQGTNKSTGVTQNSARSGNIVTHNASLADDTVVQFTVTADQITDADVIVVNHTSGGTAGGYQVAVNTVASGNFVIALRNISGGSKSEILDLQWTAIRATIA